MIQAPNLQYINAQQPTEANYQQGANNYVQTQPAQNSGTIYNYPTGSCYAPLGQPQYNGVNIEIINPQGQGIAPQGNMTIPANYYIPNQNSQYNGVNTRILNPQGQTFTPQAVSVTPEIQTPAAPVPQPQIQSQVQTEAPQAAAPVVDTPMTPDTTQTPESFAAKLKTDDLKAQKAAIEEIATIIRNDDTLAPLLLDTQIFDALVDIINKDTSSLEGPSPEVLELRQKPENELSEEEKVKATTPSPLEEAEINKQCSLYTIAFMQERLNNELEKKNGKALELSELPYIDLVIDTAKSNQNPKLRVGALAALSHIQRPEYKDDLKTIFDLAKTDEDVNVQESANKALERLNSI